MSRGFDVIALTKRLRVVANEVNRSNHSLYNEEHNGHCRLTGSTKGRYTHLRSPEYSVAPGSAAGVLAIDENIHTFEAQPRVDANWRVITYRAP